MNFGLHFPQLCQQDLFCLDRLGQRDALLPPLGNPDPQDGFEVELELSHALRHLIL